MFFGKETSLGLKITISILALVVSCILVLSFVASNNLQDMSDEQLKSIEQALEKSVLEELALEGESAAARVGSFLEHSFATTTGLAQLFSTTAMNQPMERDRIKQIIEEFLKANESLSALYSHYEPNAYDGRDSEFRNEFQHSSDTGSLDVYWVREGQNLVFYPTEDATEKYDSSRGENGVRAAEWYLCSKDSVAPCALDPYLYEIEPGKEELMTTLSTPVIKNGQFIGLVATDINLPVVQKWLKEAKANLFGGKSELTLVSQGNLLVASTKFESLIGQSVSKTSKEVQEILGANGRHWIKQNELYAKVAMPISDANVTWQLIVSVPKKVAFAPLVKMRDSASSIFNKAIGGLVMFSLIVLVAAVAISLWLSRSIAAPIETVSNSIQELASNEGDLTQSVRVDNHKELILLADGLNRFMQKLADMNRSSKNVSAQLVDQIGLLSDSALVVKGDTDEQQMNLDNIATAINQMSATATEVSKLASDTAQSAGQANQVLTTTQGSLSASVEEVQQLSLSMEQTAQQVSNVASRSSDITSIVATIQGIAEQTNLLALNAAIEAARAGEQGRGFAVVADEVRGLASRTQTSTKEISDLIQSLQADVDKAVAALAQIQSEVESTVTKTNESYQQLSEGLSSIQQISDSADQVATASEEQSQVSEDISMRVVAVSDSSKQLAQQGDNLEAMSANSNTLIAQMDEQLNRLKS